MSGASGGVSILVGASATTGSDIAITAGDSSASTGGSVVLVSGTGGANPAGSTSRGSVTFDGPLFLRGGNIATVATTAAPTISLAYTVSVLTVTTDTVFTLPTPIVDGKYVVLTRRSTASVGACNVTAGVPFWVFNATGGRATTVMLPLAGDHLQLLYR